MVNGTSGRILSYKNYVNLASDVILWDKVLTADYTVHHSGVSLSMTNYESFLYTISKIDPADRTNIRFPRSNFFDVASKEPGKNGKERKKGKQVDYLKTNRLNLRSSLIRDLDLEMGADNVVENSDKLRDFAAILLGSENHASLMILDLRKGVKDELVYSFDSSLGHYSSECYEIKEFDGNVSKTNIFGNTLDKKEVFDVDGLPTVEQQPDENPRLLN
jgi:hypothetical protein